MGLARVLEVITESAMNAIQLLSTGVTNKSRCRWSPERGVLLCMDSEARALLATNQAKTHEFVNSLSSVRSLAELLIDNPGLDAGERSRFIEIIRDQTERLIRLMAQVQVEADTTS